MPLKITELILWILAVYGMFSLISSVVGLIRLKSHIKCQSIKLVLLVKDAEDCIEYVVRNLAGKDFLTGVLPNKNISIVDINSTDNTYLITKKLKRYFQNIEVLRFNERENIFDETAIFSHSQK